MKLQGEIKGEPFAREHILNWHKGEPLPEYRPTLAFITFGNDASDSYLKSLVKMNKDADGVPYINIARFDATKIGKYPDRVKHLVETLSNNSSITSIMIDQPFPSCYCKADKEEIIAALDPKKDVDCLTTYNKGLCMTGDIEALPCTAKAAFTLLKESCVLSFQSIVIFNRNDIGLSLAAVLTKHNATVTVVHTHTAERAKIRLCWDADVIVTATGCPGTIQPHYINGNNPFVVDIGYPNDVPRTEEMMKKVHAITAAKGGLGPITAACVIDKTLRLAVR